MFGSKKEIIVVEEGKPEPFIYYSSRKIPIVKYRVKLTKKYLDENGNVIKVSEGYVDEI